jgi:PAS domain S-box-containing protein
MESFLSAAMPSPQPVDARALRASLSQRLGLSVAPGTEGAADIYRAIFDHANVGIFASTPDARFLTANAALAQIFGYASAEELMAVDNIAARIYADPATREEFKRRAESPGGVSGLVMRAKRQDGRGIWMSATAAAVRDADGRTLYYIGTVEDVTDRTEAELAAQAAERSYRQLFEHTTVGLYRSSPDGKQLRANAALVRLNGYDNEEEMLSAVGNIATEWYVDPNRRDEFTRILDVHGHVDGFVSEVHRHKTRERIWISESARAVRGEDGRILHYEGTVTDITAQIRAEAANRAREAAEAISRAKSEFLANMSHELRTPLNAILGFTQIMRREMFGPLGATRYKTYAEDIHDSALHLLRLIEDILDTAKAEAATLTLSEEVFDIEPVIVSAMRMLREDAAKTKLSIDLVPGAAALRLRADRRRFQQVVLNLLSNAVKFTPAGGRVTVSATEAAGAITVTVADSGIGISPADLERIFEPFVQLDRTRFQEGAGLGLPLCQQLMHAHGGTLRLTSELGQGTRAEACFPKERNASPA